MSNVVFKRWHAVHSWTSLICTAFLFLLCLTGLPLVFHHELDDWLGNGVDAPAMPAGTPQVSLDSLEQGARASRPGDVIQYIIWERDTPDTAAIVMAPRANTPPDDTQTVISDMRTAQVIGQPPSRSLTFVLLKLHTDMFAGLPGKLFLGAMGLLFIAAIVSGVVVYGPLMRKLDFGEVRASKERRVRWLDLHNLLGIATLAWVLVVGFTGVMSTLADLTLDGWRNNELAAMVSAYKGSAAPSRLGSLDVAVANARQAAPGMIPSFIAFPGTNFSSAHHYAFFMRGDTPLTSNLLKPVLIDAETSQVTDARDLPWYMTAILVAKPLHFGDYGGMPLKIIWGLFDVAAIVVLGSGLYLWIARRRKSKGQLARTKVAKRERA